jgi:hypothetical protein
MPRGRLPGQVSFRCYHQSRLSEPNLAKWAMWCSRGGPMLVDRCHRQTYG